MPFGVCGHQKSTVQSKLINADQVRGSLDYVSRELRHQPTCGLLMEAKYPCHGGVLPPPPPVPSVRPGHPSARSGVRQFNDSDGSMITFLSGSIAMSITPQRND